MENDLAKAFDEMQASKKKEGYTCIVEVKNQTPPNWNALIGGGCKFTYQDHNGNDIGNYTDYHTNIDVRTGSSLFFQSNQPQSCVKRVELVITVVTPLLPNPQTMPATDSVDKDHCMINPSWVIGQQKQQLRSELEKGNNVSFEIKAIS